VDFSVPARPFSQKGAAVRCISPVIYISDKIDASTGELGGCVFGAIVVERRIGSDRKTVMWFGWPLGDSESSTIRSHGQHERTTHRRVRTSYVHMRGIYETVGL